MYTFLFGTYMILTIWIIGFVVAFRKQITCMVGMMTAMALGMAIGLALGTLLAVWLPGQFFQSTVLSMLIGGMIGGIAGAPISMMAVLDGLLSGVMGGMMGTMLMVMMPSPYVEITVKLMSVFCSGIVFLLFIMLLGEVKPRFTTQKPPLLSHPIFMFSVIVLLVLVQLNSADRQLSLPRQAQHPSEHVHDSSSNQLGQSSLVEQELLVKATEYSFFPASTRVVVGQKIKITLDNSGTMEHDFEIVGTNIHIHAAPGKKNSMIVSLDKAGYYQVICTLAGHKEAGMTASIHVTNP